MFIKHLLPLSIRNHLRPYWKRLLPIRRAITTSQLWPKPVEWREAKNSFDAVTDPAALFRIATKEFGILQLENEIVAFLNHVAAHQPVVIGEIGIKHGGNSFMFLRGLPRVTKYLGMDLRLENIEKLKFFRRDTQQLHLLEGDSQLPSSANRARKILAKKQFDFLFIDGDHEYDGVLQDLIQWYPLVRPGGLIAFHDIVPGEEIRSGKQPQANGFYAGDVHRLWAVIKPHFENWEFVDDWQQGGFGIGVIVKKDETHLDELLLAALGPRYPQQPRHRYDVTTV